MIEKFVVSTLSAVVPSFHSSTTCSKRSSGFPLLRIASGRNLLKLKQASGNFSTYHPEGATLRECDKQNSRNGHLEQKQVQRDSVTIVALTGHTGHRRQQARSSEPLRKMA